MSLPELIAERLKESIRAKEDTLKDTGNIARIGKAVVECLKNGKKIYFFGNGGSAADSQHLAAELVSRFFIERKGIPAEALNTNTSVITAIGNDYSYDRIFARQIEASGAEGDIAVGISTSGNSPNVLEALKSAKAKGMITVGMTGRTGGKLKAVADFCFCAPSDVTPRIQEVHITVGHIICEIAEQELFGT